MSQAQRQIVQSTREEAMITAWGAGIMMPARRDIPRIFFNPRGRVYTFGVNFDLASITTSLAASTLTAYSFSLGQLPNATDFSSLFDEWRIQQVTINFIPTSLTQNLLMAPIHTVIDLDDATVPAAVTDLEQYDTHMVTQADTAFSRTLAPKCALAAYSGAFTSYSSARPWVDVASPNVQWYGVKLAATSSAGGAAIIITVSANLILQCRANR